MEYMWMRTSRVEAAQMERVHMNLDFNCMTNSYGSTQPDHTQCSQAANKSKEVFPSLVNMYAWLW
jgi:hypothetical protein